MDIIKSLRKDLNGHIISKEEKIIIYHLMII